MHSRDELILATGTLNNPPLDTLLLACVAVGYTGLSIWPVDVAAWRADGTTDSEARARIEGAGLNVPQVECLFRWPQAGSAEAAAEEAEVFEVAANLGSQIVSILSPGNDRYSEAQLTEAMAGICERAASRGFDIALEVAPWKGPVDLAMAVRIICGTGHSTARLVIDSWHMYRGQSAFDDLRAIPAGRVAAIQLSDAPAVRARPEFFDETMTARLLPGDGDYDLDAFLSALDLNADGVPVTVEVLSDDMRALSPAEAAIRTAEATRKTLAAHAARSA
ncbi:MAG TPA: sugar phosphate isomerase/epimerase [Frankiaceae bacterium]|nr:sugar phosphate isomerase/epimerase [Frankiaceae bacterium]